MANHGREFTSVRDRETKASFPSWVAVDRANTLAAALLLLSQVPWAF